MTGRPGHRTMEMNGGSSVPYLARTPCVPLFSTLFIRGGNRRAFRLPGPGGESFPLYGGTFARSYSASINVFLRCSDHDVIVMSSDVLRCFPSATHVAREMFLRSALDAQRRDVCII